MQQIFQPTQLKLTKSIIRVLTYVGLTLATFFLTFFIIKHTDPSTTHHRSVVFNKPSLETVTYVTDIKVVNCYTLWSCSAPSQEADWFKIPKPLSIDKKTLKPTSWFIQQYLFIQKKPCSSIQSSDMIITDLNVYEGKMITFGRESFNIEETSRYYYDLDVLYGVDSVDPRVEWSKLSNKPYYPHLQINEMNEMPIYLTVQSMPSSSKNPSPELIISKDNFKILQVADLHFSTGVGKCRDQYPEIADCQADPRTLTFIDRVLDYEKPDMIALTGDQIFGEDSFDSQTTLFKSVAPFIEKKIPYIFTFGNHDDEGSLNRIEIFNLLKTLPYFVHPEEGLVENVDGVGNFAVQLFKDNNKTNPLSTFYILDSHKYTPQQKLYPGYDWIKESQLNYIKSLHSRLPIPIIANQHTSLAFFHIPLPEYRHDFPRIGSYKEGITAPFYNTHARDLLKELGVSFISVGHDHCNDFCLNDKNGDKNDGDGVWLCYGGAVGEGGYAGYGGTTRRLRVIELNWDKEEGVSLKTWKWLETDLEMKERFDEGVLVRGGVAVDSS